MKQPRQSEPLKKLGFTIVEVLIVLSIGSLIILVVFMAIPQLQRNSRNGQRAADAAKVLSAVNECASNSNGVLSACLTAASGSNHAGLNSSQYSGSDPVLGNTGSATLDMSKQVQLQNVYIWGNNTTIAQAGSINTTDKAYVLGNYTCNGSTATPGAVNQFVVLYERESGSSTPTDTCLASQ